MAQRSICLVTSAQPSTNPRLVKEADALSECGDRVLVVCSRSSDWAVEADRVLLQSKAWSCIHTGSARSTNSLLYWSSRVRHGLFRRLHGLTGSKLLDRYTLLRGFPELNRKAKSIAADLYIAHNIEALPAAAAAASIHKKPLGFDGEDFHTGMKAWQVPPFNTLIERLERKYLPQCSYVTAASPGIAQAYAAKYGIPQPACILNVFPLDLRRGISHSSLGNSAGPLRLYWMSQTIGDARGLEDIVAAMGLAGECNIELHLQGHWQAGYREHLLGLARSAGVPEVRIHGLGPADPDRLVAISAGFDVGLDLQPPVDENRDICLTNKLFTYILAGNAVIAAATKGQAPLARSLGPAAYLYDPGDIQALAAGLRSWHNDRAALQTARDHAWRLGTTRYNWDIEKKRFLEVVEAALRLPGEQPRMAKDAHGSKQIA